MGDLLSHQRDGARQPDLAAILADIFQPLQVPFHKTCRHHSSLWLNGKGRNGSDQVLSPSQQPDINFTRTEAESPRPKRRQPPPGSRTQNTSIGLAPTPPTKNAAPADRPQS